MKNHIFNMLEVGMGVILAVIVFALAVIAAVVIVVMLFPYGILFILSIAILCYLIGLVDKIFGGRLANRFDQEKE